MFNAESFLEVRWLKQTHSCDFLAHLVVSHESNFWTSSVRFMAQHSMPLMLAGFQAQQLPCGHLQMPWKMLPSCLDRALQTMTAQENHRLQLLFEDSMSTLTFAVEGLSQTLTNEVAALALAAADACAENDPVAAATQATKRAKV
jgi:hypothetical protein